MAANTFIQTLKDHRSVVLETVADRPDWEHAVKTFDAFFQQMADPGHGLWSETMIEELHRQYYQARDADKECKNITERTLKAMPVSKGNDVKKIFLQIANTCRIFHAGHKVNFEALEIPENFEEIPMAPKKKGIFTYAEPMPTLYPKISLTFDYWVPKILDWTLELRQQGAHEWRGEASFQYESCTDFMRIALLFLSDPAGNLPICKPDIRQALLEKIFDETFVWIKKSAKREDIAENNKALRLNLEKAASRAATDIPAEAWNRVLALAPVKALLK